MGRFNYGYVSGELQIRLDKFRQAVIKLCTTLSILADLELKGSEYCADIAAILANCCDYPIGLDLNTLKDKKCSLSTTIVALYFLNGELFKTVPQGALIDTAKHTEPLIIKPMAQFLRGLSLDLEVPGPVYELSFMKYLRFSKVELTPAGI
ncbi:hypothetical protein B0J12DRAFT_706295 [Macrophomina phaseolina]|uniref:Uncharacterized protein n=1 Tax=Macrophomina phaseolina TaxID=35725 RepID=A0ABQ8FPE8_9PEZI|nr:hypothetical protein B0J12DRAFT_706295 [Macrophomina phaseolina]